MIVAAFPADDAFVVQLACESLHILVKVRFKHSGGVKPHVKGWHRAFALAGQGGRRGSGEPARVSHDVGQGDVLDDC